jgi:hypothetical protein
MIKIILWITLIFWWWGYYLANSSYVPISKQIDVKTMQIYKPIYLLYKWNKCIWSCKNYSSNSSYWWGSFWWK